MHRISIAAIVATLFLPAAAMAGPEGTFHVAGVNPDDGSNYTGTVTISRKGEVYRVVWRIGSDETVGVGIGMRFVDGQIVAGAASKDDTAIAVAYAMDKTPGNATYTEFSDGTWRGVWAYKGSKNVALEEWIPTVRQIKAKADMASKPKVRPVTTDIAETPVEEARIEGARRETTPIRILSSPLPASASPKH